MAINLFANEFMKHPIPLEISFNACTYGCKYCFVDKDKYTMKDSIRSIVNTFQQNNRATFAKELLYRKFPVLKTLLFRIL